MKIEVDDCGRQLDDHSSDKRAVDSLPKQRTDDSDAQQKVQRASSMVDAAEGGSSSSSSDRYQFFDRLLFVVDVKNWTFSRYLEA